MNCYQTPTHVVKIPSEAYASLGIARVTSHDHMPQALDIELLAGTTAIAEPLVSKVMRHRYAFAVRANARCVV